MSEQNQVPEDEINQAMFDSAWEHEMNPDAPGEKAPGEKAPAEEAPAEEAPAEEAPAEEAPAEEAPAEPVDDTASRLQRIEEMLRPQSTEPIQPEPAPAQPVLSEAEQAALKEFENEWPDVSAAISLIMKRERDEIYRQVADTITPMLNPLMQNYQQSAASQHYTQLTAAHPDYDTIRDSVAAWVEKQPAFLRPAYEKVAANGSTQDVIELINRYKAENNLTSTPQSVQTPVASSKEPSEKAKKAASSLGAVESKRSVVPVANESNDFDSAWEQALKMI